MIDSDDLPYLHVDTIVESNLQQKQIDTLQVELESSILKCQELSNKHKKLYRKYQKLIGSISLVILLIILCFKSNNLVSIGKLFFVKNDKSITSLEEENMRLKGQLSEIINYKWHYKQRLFDYMSLNGLNFNATPSSGTGSTISNTHSIISNTQKYSTLNLKNQTIVFTLDRYVKLFGYQFCGSMINWRLDVMFGDDWVLLEEQNVPPLPPNFRGKTISEYELRSTSAAFKQLRVTQTGLNYDGTDVLEIGCFNLNGYILDEFGWNEVTPSQMTTSIKKDTVH